MTGITVTLPDGAKKHFEHPVSVYAVAESIGSGLARATVAGEVDGQLCDASTLIEGDVNLQLITAESDAGLSVIRHSTAHLLAHAVQRLFPTAQVTIGPVIDNGFYYDFAYERPFTPDDLVRIEAEMRKLAAAAHPITRRVLTSAEAVALFKEKGEHFKVEIIESIEDEVLTAYAQDDFIDLCRGPHVRHTGQLTAFKLMKVAGAYWRGDASQPMLQRIYGTAWPTHKALKAYLHQLEEAEKRDHRVVGKKMNLFHFQKEAPGMVFWHPKGWMINQIMRDYLKGVTAAAGYGEINTPQLVEQTLWVQSGHLAKFSDEMFQVTSDKQTYAIKPMSCPCHVQVFNQGLKSYRDLPIRYAEFGCCHRHEPSGTLHGLMRVRAMVQDDGHIFCTEAQVQEEVLAFIQQLHRVYRDFGFTEILHKLSTRPEKRVGDDAVWDKSEAALTDALNASGVDWEILPGEGAFYGPKIEFSLKDCLGRVWQCGTIQVDFSTPGRLAAEYVDANGEKQTPVMLHRAIFGSIERFMGILLEHYEGRLPVWLMPEQVVVMSIADRHAEYATELVDQLKKEGFRATIDLRNEKIGFKIREQSIARVPFQLIIGDKEVAESRVSLRGESGQTESLSVQGLLARLAAHRLPSFY